MRSDGNTAEEGANPRAPRGRLRAQREVRRSCASATDTRLREKCVKIVDNNEHDVGDGPA